LDSIGAAQGRPPLEQSEVTRLLCAAAYLRPATAVQVRTAAKNKVAAVAAARTPRAIRKLRARQGPEEETADTAKSPPRILEGHDYVRWVRKRIAVGRPVPSSGFDLAPVVECCAQAERLLRLRRGIITLAWLATVLCLFKPVAVWAPLPGLTGTWAAFYLDRMWARRRLRSLAEPGVSPRTAARGVSRRRRRVLDRLKQLKAGYVVPYSTEVRSAGAKYHFVGAGKVWFEAQVGIDVAPAVPDPDGKDPTGDPFAAGLRKTPRPIRRLEDLLGPQSEPSRVIPFDPDDLHAYVSKQLKQPVDPSPRFHPESRLEVFGIAAISGDRWADISPDRWGALVSLAQAGTTTTTARPTPHIARRFLCARMISWDGELVASIFVSFAYEDHFLRVIVRPHVINPLHPRLRSVDAAATAATWLWHCRAWLDSLCDVGVTVYRLWKRNRRRRPEFDSGKGPVSLREAYSTRYMDDMLQYDDARRYIQMMERRIFTAVKDFLVDHNVDTGTYVAQTIEIINSGVINSGTISGDIQNQPGATNSYMSSGSPGGP
jgi:hypothetical protein